MPHLYITDLDGTLLDDTSHVSERSAKLLNNAISRGALFTVATARTPATVEILMKDVDLRLPAIVMTGAAMWDSSTSLYTEARFISDELTRKAVDVFRCQGLEPFMYCIRHGMLHVYHHGELSEQQQAFVDARTGLRLKQFHLDATAAQVEDAKNVILIFGMGTYDHLSRVAEVLNADGEYSVSFYEDNASDQYYIEVFTRGVSKAEAVKRLATMVGADEITVYGDNLNDISMMAVASDSAAVANAKPEVLTTASRIIASNNEDAVAVDVNNHFRCHD